MQIHLEIVYDTQTKSIGFKYSLPGLFGERRDWLYVMLERTREELMLQLAHVGDEHQTIEEPYSPGTFGKGTKSNADG